MGDHSRQYGDTLEKIRGDHVARYQFAATRLARGARIYDIACGCGYGSWILHRAGARVTGIDIHEPAVIFAREHYPGPTYETSDAQNLGNLEADALISFETLEHLAEPTRLLKAVASPLIIASVPNEAKWPFDQAKFADDDYPHQRHYTPDQFEALLYNVGYVVKERWCQRDKLAADVVRGIDGNFLIYIGER